ncbi:MAG TPA: hypothetical protein VMR98_03745 [Candidatus Polarisedimenticolaceae bacterium]|nr:hypothetical protein [Candidatus Polarisedimenticolaceae bacterium]
MRVRDAALWEGTKGEHGDDMFRLRICQCAEAWAKQMEDRIDCGLTVEEAASSGLIKLSRNMSLDERSLMIELVVEHWIHGRQLHRWVHQLASLLNGVRLKSPWVEFRSHTSAGPALLVCTACGQQLRLENGYPQALDGFHGNHRHLDRDDLWSPGPTD